MSSGYLTAARMPAGRLIVVGPDIGDVGVAGRSENRAAAA